MTCLLCVGEKMKKVHDHGDGHALFRCVACGLLQTVPMPDAVELDAYYQKYDVMGERDPYYREAWGADALVSVEGREARKRYAWAKGVCGPLGRRRRRPVGRGREARLPVRHLRKRGAINAEVEAKFCTDKSRYFATGFSYGGSMSFTAACNMSDIFRAIGAESGSTVSGATCATKVPARKVAIWATHGDADTTLPIKNTTPMIDALVKDNGCTTTTKPVDPSPCVEYQGCAAGYPVIWCVRPGDPHAMASFAPDAITKFFKQFF